MPMPSSKRATRQRFTARQLRLGVASHEKKHLTPVIKATEHQEAVVFKQQIDLWGKKFKGLRWLFHVPNGGQRSKAVAAKLKAEGTQPGIPDYIFPIQLGGYVGLAIELKAIKGRVDPKQWDWLHHLRAQGWRAEVCYGAADALLLVWEYIHQPRAGDIGSGNGIRVMDEDAGRLCGATDSLAGAQCMAGTDPDREQRSFADGSSTGGGVGNGTTWPTRYWPGYLVVHCDADELLQSQGSQGADGRLSRRRAGRPVCPEQPVPDIGSGVGCPADRASPSQAATSQPAELASTVPGGDLCIERERR